METTTVIDAGLMEVTGTLVIKNLVGVMEGIEPGKVHVGGNSFGNQCLSQW